MMTLLKKRHKRRKKQKKDTSSSDNDNIDSHSSKTIIKREKEDDKKEHGSKYSRYDKMDDSKSNVRKGKLSEDRNPMYERSRKYMREEYDTNSKRQRCDSNKQRDGSRNKYNDRRYSLDKQNDKTTSNSKKISAVKSVSNTDHIKYKDKNEKYRPKARSSLTEREKEQRRQEMMANAMWRDKEREKNVKIYREQEKKEEQTTNALDNKDFIRKQLVVATEVGTVASRIKANINNIQRSGRAMDTNFAKR